MPRQYDFSDSNKIGYAGQQVVHSYLESLEDVLQVTDVSSDPVFQEHGVDLLWKVHQEPTYDKPSREPKSVSGDVKTDRWISRTNNFFLEVDRNEGLEKPGWIFTSIADRLLYLAWQDQVLYDLSMDQVCDFVGLEGHKYRKRTTTTKSKFSKESLYSTSGILAPKQHLLSFVRDWQEVDVSLFYV